MTFRRSLRATVTLTSLAALLTLGACGTSETTPPTPTTASTSTPQPGAAPSEAPVPPEKPAAMANDDEAGARAAADYFLALYGYTYQSGDPTLLDDFCYDESTFCANVNDALKAQIEAEESYVGGELTWVENPAAEKPDESSMYIFTGDIQQAPLNVSGPDGKEVASSETELVHGGVAVYFDANEWAGFDIGIDEPSSAS